MYECRVCEVKSSVPFGWRNRVLTTLCWPCNRKFKMGATGLLKE